MSSTSLPEGRPAPPDRDRFLTIVRQCEAMLLGYARRLCRGDYDRAQDLVQDALVRAYDAFRQGRFIEGYKPCAWLSRILTNGFLNAYRREKRWEAGVTVEALTAGGETGPPQTRAGAADLPEAALLTATFEEPLERALAALPEALRLTVLLVDVEEYSYAEAAEWLQVPIGTIRSRLARARYQLQETLSEYARERGLR